MNWIRYVFYACAGMSAVIAVGIVSVTARDLYELYYDQYDVTTKAKKDLVNTEDN